MRAIRLIPVPVLLVLCVLAGDASALTWPVPVNVGAAANDATSIYGPPSVAINASGRGWILWSNGGPVHAARVAGGVPASGEVLDSFQCSVRRGHSVAINPTGNALAAWGCSFGPTQTVRRRSVSAEGQWGTQVSTSADVFDAPASHEVGVGVTDAGSGLVTSFVQGSDTVTRGFWSSVYTTTLGWSALVAYTPTTWSRVPSDQSSNASWAFAPTGRAISAAFHSSGGGSAFAIALSTWNGTVWTNADPFANGVHMGDVTSIATGLNASTTSPVGFVVWNRNDAYTVAGTDTLLTYRRWDGTAWGTAAAFPSTVTGATPVTPTVPPSMINVKVANDGTALAVWKQTNTDVRIVWSRWDGSAWSPAAFLDDAGGSDRPQVAMSRIDGRAIVVYQHTVGGVQQVQVRTLTPGATTWSAPDTLSQSAGVSSLYPAVAMDDSGEALVAWAEPVSGALRMFANTADVPGVPPPTWTPPGTLTGAGALSFGLDFSTPVTGIAAADFSNTGTATGCAITPSAASGSTITVTVTGCSEGTLILTLGAGNVTGPASSAQPATQSAAPTVTIDRTAPSVASFTTSSSAHTNATSIPYLLTLSEEVTGIGTSGFSNAGTAAGCTFAPGNDAGTSRTVTITGCSDGTLIPRLGVGAAGDLVGNTSTAASDGPTVTIDRTAPSVASFTTRSALRTNMASISFLLTLSEPVTGIEALDFSGAGTATGCIFHPGAGSGSTFTLTVTGCSEGTIIPRLVVGAASDMAGNGGPITRTDGPTVTRTGPTPEPPASPGTLVGVSIDADAVYTTTGTVRLTVVWPRGSRAMLISNDRGFTSPVRVDLTAGMPPVPWTLDPVRRYSAPRTVYVRFSGDGIDPARTVTDAITFDPVAPSVTISPLASEASRPPGPYALRITARDGQSGLAGVQVSTSARRPPDGPPRRATHTVTGRRQVVTVQSPARPRWVRVSDRAGNWSPWKPVRIRPPERQAPRAGAPGGGTRGMRVMAGHRVG